MSDPVAEQVAAWKKALEQGRSLESVEVAKRVLGQKFQMAVAMPWTGKQFASRHNKALKGKAADKAAAQANAMLKAGVPEGEAIATANKHANKAKPRKAKWYDGK